MYRDVKKDSMWMAAAAQLPARNRHPPGRHPADSILMVSNGRQTQKNPQPPVNSSPYRPKDAISPSIDTSAMVGVQFDSPGGKIPLTSENLARAPVTRGMIAKSKNEETMNSLRLSSIENGGAPVTGKNEVSSVGDFRDNTPALANATNVDKICDVRNEIAPPHKLEAIEGIIHKDPWMGEGDDDAHFLCTSYNMRFINAWRSQVPNDIKADFLDDSDNENHAKYPVNTETGTLMDRVDQPESTRNPEVLKPDQKEHADHWTSNFLIAREIRLREKRRVVMDKQQATPVPAPTCHVFTQQAPQPKVEVDCILRPAKQSDVPAIIDIYNWEIKRGHRAFDSELVTKDDIYTIGNNCRKQCLPFIVAVRQSPDLTDPSIWPSKDAWESYMKMPQKPTQEAPLVIGFAFCEGLKIGFGKAGHVGQQSVKLQLYVHHDYRRKNVGGALMDRTLTHMSRFHIPDKIKHN